MSCGVLGNHVIHSLCLKGLSAEGYASTLDDIAGVDDPVTRPPWGEFGRAFTLAGVGIVGKFVLNILNSTEIRNEGRFQRAVGERPRGLGLITVCNHTSTVDDPFVITALLPVPFLWHEPQHKQNRWSLCAKEICFRNALLEQFFRSGKVMPIERGAGLGQHAMHVAAARAAAGDWVHLFPEGKVIYGGSLAPCKWGVGKLICDCVQQAGKDPVILPFYHSNMGRVMPKGSIVPRAGHNVTITVGSPLDVSDLTPHCHVAAQQEEQHAVWQAITVRIASALQELELSSPPNWVQIEGHGSADEPQHESPPVEPHPAV